MTNSGIITSPVILTVAAVAAFLVIMSWFTKQKILSGILTVASALAVLACMTYALLLGASLNEVLTLLCVFIFLNLFSYLPGTPKKTEEKQEAAPEAAEKRGEEKV